MVLNYYSFKDVNEYWTYLKNIYIRDVHIPHLVA